MSLKSPWIFFTQTCGHPVPGRFIFQQASAYGMHRTWMALGQLPGIHHKGSVASKFAGPQPHFWGVMLDAWACHKLHPNLVSITKLKQARHCRWPGIACHRNWSTRLLKPSHNGRDAGGGHFEHSKVTCQTSDKLFTVISTTLFAVSTQTFFSVQKSLMWSH